jgi:hypothetical protein
MHSMSKIIYSWGADCLGSSAGLLPDKTPVVWPYVTGTPDVAWSAERIRQFRDAGAAVYLVDQGFGSRGPFDADEFDVEAGAWTEGEIVAVIRARREHKWATLLYGTYSTRDAVTAELVRLGIERSVYWRVADWDLSQHLADEELWGDVYAGQWASPASNPHTLLPGTSLTLRQANVDLNVVLRESTGWEG